MECHLSVGYRKSSTFQKKRLVLFPKQTVVEIANCRAIRHFIMVRSQYFSFIFNAAFAASIGIFLFIYGKY